MSKNDHIAELYRQSEQLDRIHTTIVAVAAAMVGFFVGATLVGKTTSGLKKEAIERGFAIHDPQTGEWRWIDEKEDKP